MPSYILLLFIFLAQTANAILPENVGSTQFAAGYINTAQIYEDPVKKYGEKHGWSVEKTQSYSQKIEDIMVSGPSDIPMVIEKISGDAEARSDLFKMISAFQEQDRYRKPSLIMIGDKRAAAVDGHHRIRGMEKLSMAMEEAEKNWPKELKEILEPLKRVKSDGSFINSFSMLKAKIITSMSAKSSAEDVVRELLKLEMGFWDSEEDASLARKFSGRNAKNANEKILKKLAQGLGMSNDGKGVVVFKAIVDLPDSPMRSFVERYFESRHLKTSGVTFRTYNEFYTAVDIKAAIENQSNELPNLRRMLSNNLSVLDQQEMTSLAMKELDELFVTNDQLGKKLLKRALKGTSVVRVGVEKIRYDFCSGSSLPICKPYLSGLTEEKAGLSSELFVPGGNCFLNPDKNHHFKALNQLLKE